MNTYIEVLVIEDDPVDFQLLQRSLKSHTEYQLKCVTGIAQALNVLAEAAFDIILLDLTLTDSSGTASIPFLKEVTSAPVIIITGIDLESTAIEALKNGAQDYLIKGKFEVALLVKSINYAIERSRLLEELDEQRALVQRAWDQRLLDETTPSAKTPASANSHGLKLLKEDDPVVFRYAASQYGEILDRVVEQRKYKVEYDVTARLSLLADQLGRYKVSPRDIVEIHTEALQRRNKENVVGKVKIYNEEARFLLSGLLGHLCSFYRSHCFDLPAPLSIDVLVESVKQRVIKRP